MEFLTRLWSILWRCVLFLILWGLLLAPFIALLVRPHRLLLEVISLATLLVALWIMLRFIDKRPLLSIGFQRRRALRDLVAGIAIGTLWLFVSIAPLWALGWASFHAPSQWVARAVALMTAAILLNAITQEVIARGYVFQTTQRFSNVIVAIVVSSAFFAALHIGAFTGRWLPAINVFIAGVLFALAYVATSNLWLPIGIHFAWNALLGPILGASVSGQDVAAGARVLHLHGPELWTGGAFGVEGSLAVTITALLICAVLAYFSVPLGRKTFPRETSSL